MKKLLIPVLVGSVLLSSCARKSDLPPEQVLQKSAAAVANLQSGDLSMLVRLSVPESIDMSLQSRGSMQNGGKQFLLNSHLQGTVIDGSSSRFIDTDFDLAVEAENKVYVRINSLTVTPADPSLSADAIAPMLGTWFILPSSAEAMRGMSDVSPDPKLLQAQSQVVSVTNDLGIEKVDGKDAYHYQVTLDPEKLVAFLQTMSSAAGQEFDPAAAMALSSLFAGKGELWIDHETSFTRRIIWDFSPTDESLSFTLNLTAELGNYNNAAQIEFPVDAKPWPQDATLFGQSVPLPETQEP